MEPINLKLEDFIEIADENRKRVYYFEAPKAIELIFFSDGIPVRSLVNKATITNTEAFRNHRLFAGSKQLTEPYEKDGKSMVFNVIEPEPKPSKIMKQNYPTRQKVKDEEIGSVQRR